MNTYTEQTKEQITSLEKQVKYLENRLMLCESALGCVVDIIKSDLAHNMARDRFSDLIRLWTERVNNL